MSDSRVSPGRYDVPVGSSRNARARGHRVGACALVATVLACAPDWQPPAFEEPGPGRPDSLDESGEGSDMPQLGECGNGLHESGESCDDANEIWGDGCNPDCSLGGDLRWRDSLPLGEESHEVSRVVVTGDGGVVVLLRTVSGPVDPLTVAWRADGSVAWTRRPEWEGSDWGAPREALVLGERVLTMDRSRVYNADAGIYEWELHLETLDRDGDVVHQQQIDMPISNGNYMPAVHVATGSGGAELLLGDGEHLAIRDIDLQSGELGPAESTDMLLDYSDEILGALRLPDGTLLLCVGGNFAFVSELYRIGADRAVTQWDQFQLAGFAQLHQVGDSVLLLHTIDMFYPPVVRAFSLEGEHLGNWDMTYSGEQLFTEWYDAAATRAGEHEFAFLDRVQGYVGRQSIDGTARWLRAFNSGAFEPAVIAGGAEASLDLIVAGTAPTLEAGQYLVVESRAP
jgi:cysteine-rich repeat protein